MSLPTTDPLMLIEDLLRQRIGLKPETVGRDRIGQAVAARVSHHRCNDVASYLPLVLDSEQERRALVDEVVVPETWFFRDARAFRHLRRQALRWRLQFPQEKLRFLSVPCCTGEEPYSMAMLLLDVGLLAEHIEIVASDISATALASAQRGAYPEWSFREEEADFQVLRDRYCRRNLETYVVSDDVRAAVRFVQANLVGPQFLDTELPFHAIFCRNLFIYLEDPARQTALAHLRRLLRPDGILYLASVEAGFYVGTSFRRHPRELPFVFSKDEGRGAVKEAAPRPGADKPRSPTLPAKAPPRAPGGKDTKRVRLPAAALRQRLTDALAQMPNEPPKPTATDDLLARAQQAADAGRLEEGAKLCADLLARGSPQAQVYYLLGVVRQAQGDSADAERCFQRALYLDPRHREALVHAALLARRRGDERTAETYLQRVQRLDQEGKS